MSLKTGNKSVKTAYPNKQSFLITHRLNSRELFSSDNGVMFTDQKRLVIVQKQQHVKRSLLAGLYCKGYGDPQKLIRTDNLSSVYACLHPSAWFIPITPSYS